MESWDIWCILHMFLWICIYGFLNATIWSSKIYRRERASENACHPPQFEASLAAAHMLLTRSEAEMYTRYELNGRNGRWPEFVVAIYYCFFCLLCIQLQHIKIDFFLCFKQILNVLEKCSMTGISYDDVSSAKFRISVVPFPLPLWYFYEAALFLLPADEWIVHLYWK